MEDDNIKKCPYCGEEIKASAVKCKHCKTFLQEENATKQQSTQNNTNKKVNAINWCMIPILIVFIAIYYFDLNEELELSEPISSNTQSELNITGKYSSDFGGYRALAYSFEENGNCLEKAVGKSLVKGIITYIEESSPYNRSDLYNISRQNPNLKFEVTNPTPQYNSYGTYCKADLIFKNYKSDTIAGYKGYGQNAKPYMMNNAYFTVTYSTSQLGDKYKAYVKNINGQSLEGYEE